MHSVSYIHEEGKFINLQKYKKKLYIVDVA